MCIIAAIPKGSSITKREFFNMWESNPDGGGLMWAVNGKINVTKELHKPDILYQNYLSIKPQNVSCVLHFRIGTSGSMDAYNIHPFKINDHLYFCHNGILNIDVPKNSKENDTQIFNNSLLKQLPEDFIYNSAIIKLLKFAIGDNNKFVFFNSKGLIKIVNKNAGYTDKKGVWFSNMTFKKVEKRFNWNDKSDWNNRNTWQDTVCDNCMNIGELFYDSSSNWYLCQHCFSFVSEEFKGKEYKTFDDYIKV